MHRFDDHDLYFDLVSGCFHLLHLVTVYRFFGISRCAYTDEELIYSNLFREGYHDEMSGSTRLSLRLGDPSTSSTLAPNMPVCRQSLDDVSSSEEESDDEGRDPVSHGGWIFTEPTSFS
ncbi:hypothetical protein HHI36_004223 [Cryptolaemus montrouzieri]|uniref:Uncharacterized protein n=1 Tax=Cryptolaemus montrouzieri TaxID=559131 RepID=A0ABD2NQY6_9CUCU